MSSYDHTHCERTNRILIEKKMSENNSEDFGKSAENFKTEANVYFKSKN